MAAPIEDYALLSDLQNRASHIPGWQGGLALFPSVFSGILGTGDHGRWLLAPSEPGAVVVDRHYIDSTFVLQTTWKTGGGNVLVTDFMPLGDNGSSLVRRVTGLEGSAEIRQELRIRPGYSTVLPWASRARYTAQTAAPVLLAMAGPH